MTDSPANIARCLTVEKAMAALKKELRNNQHYAYTWQSAIACCAMDEGVKHEAANRIASRFMSVAFDVKAASTPEASAPAP